MVVRSYLKTTNIFGGSLFSYCKRLNFRGLKFSRIGPKLKI
ncbi:MAG: hypothetical protein PV344_06370 [Anaplasma sp.]|nr:hypothetical protein [Anaplasma sp.]